MGVRTGRLAKGHDPLQQRKGKLLEKILHLLVPKLVGPIRARAQHAQEHALSAILLAIDKGQKGAPGLRVVLVNGRVEARANVKRQIGRIAQRKEHDHAPQQIAGAAIGLVEVIEQACQAGQEHEFGGRARAEQGDVEDGKDGKADEQDNEPAQLFVGKPDEDGQRGNGQQAQQVQPAAQPKQVGDKQEPAVVLHAVAGALPVEDQPQAKAGEEDGVSVDLGLGGIKPLGVGKGQEQRGQHGAGQDADVAAVAKGLEGVSSQRAASQREHRQVDAPDGQRRRERRHKGDARGHVAQWDEREDASEQDVERRSGRVRHAKDVRGGDKFAAVPEGYGRRHGLDVDAQR